MEAPSKFIILPGNGCSDVLRSNWYGYLKTGLERAFPGIPVLAENMPDPLEAKESIWHPFILDVLGCDERSVVIGHSSGAVSLLRLLEKHKVGVAIVVSAYHTDLEDEDEAASGYFNRPWQWMAIKGNAGRILQFGSEDDFLVPWEEQEHVHDALDTELHALEDRGHFMCAEFPELLESIKKIFNKE